MFNTLPNLITLFRFFLIPFVIAVFYLDRPIGYLLAGGLFILACITDYLDGYIARKLQQTSVIGQFLDPLADKLLVASVLIMLVGFDRIPAHSLIPVIIILCREILVSGLREILGNLQKQLLVTRLAKWKTGFQMTALGCLIIGDPDNSLKYFMYVGLIILWVAAILTLYTGYDYTRKCYAFLSLEGLSKRRIK